MKGIKTISLDGEWKLINDEKSLNVPAHVPGSAYESLIDNKIIEDPFYGVREHEMSWIYNSNWQYKTEFEVNLEFLNYPNILLQFDGIDTISDIYLNGECIGSTENMFLKYEFNVKSKLKEGKNVLIVVIKSPTRKALAEMKKHGTKLTTFMALRGIPYLRKPQFSFGWDWGPKLPDIGIWQSVGLIAFDDIKIGSIYTVQEFKYNEDPLKITDINEISTIKIESAKLILNIELISQIENIGPLGCKVFIELAAPDGNNISKEVDLTEKNQSIKLEIENPQLWWTHDLGIPNLYNLTVSILSEDVIDESAMKIGIRDIQLIRNPDKWGETFYFLLNGVPIFAKGANWVPIDNFIPRGKRLGLYQMNLKYTKEANMNMLRTWGGGLYEDDLFYDLCDELGILVWQDFPFGCALYPIHKEFVENVEKEAIQNIKRLRHHASLALWCGNNEVEQYHFLYLGLSRIFRIKKRSAFKKGYRYMFEQLLPKLVNQYDPKHAYWPSSPSNGGGNNKRGIFKSNSPDKGDSHFWKVWHLNAPFSAYRGFDSRFMSEYGFESFPSMKTIASFCPSNQYDFHSPIMENHQKNRAGNKKIMKYMKRRFSIPEKFEQQVILSQITQGEAIEYGIEHWRRNRNDFHCMGSLYWQLNDCWPVASWSSLDYYGRWKALHYIAKRAYKPFFASVKEEDKSVEFWISNDLRISKTGILEWKIINSEGKTLINGSKEELIPPCSSILVESVDLSEINKNKEDLRNNIIFFSLEDNEKNEGDIYHGFRLFDNPKNFRINNPHLSYNIKELNTNPEGERTFSITIESESIALYVFIESNSVDFIASDNYFSLEPGKIREISIRITNSKEIDEMLKIHKLNDIFRINSLYNLI